MISALLGRLFRSNLSSRSGRKSNQMLFSADLSTSEANRIVVSNLVGGESGNLLKAYTMCICKSAAESK